MTDAASPIPILLCGKIPTHIKATCDIVKPEFQVIRVCSDPEAARAALTALMAPSSETPTFDGAEYPRPRAIIMGAGYTHDVFTSIRDSVDGATSVPWIRPSNVKPGAQRGSTPPPAEEIASKVRKTLDEHLEEIQAGTGAGEVWWM
ncbi:hypothetical protein DL764_007479 [Monosporascus ibericus]|uniref:Uncharacterized protein n=1 Tax=Monosporascus ibericus TaxID=155417 RepID=A0A4Q4T0D0_9PEZI|nr:hypothetical protein DL764_007479 [Monosporascus ibericus]